MDAADHERFYDDIGAYLLGAQSSDEQLAFERHLGRCHVCQDELNRLAVAADALPYGVAQYEPPGSLKRELMRRVDAHARPRMRRWPRLPPLRIAAIAAACVVIGLVVGHVLPADHTSPVARRSVAASVDASRIGQAHATIQLYAGGGSGRLTVSSMPQPGAGEVYEIWVKRGPDVQPAALFDVDQNGNGHGALPDDLRGVTRVFVTRERRGGAHQPTEAPVVSARI